MKGATVTLLDDYLDTAVSIHAPNEGSDTGHNLLSTASEVSIHAPNEGSDSQTFKR